MPHPIGTVAELWRFPVKSMAGERLTRTTFGTLGIPGDRGWALRDEAAQEIRGAKKLPVLMQCAARYDAEPTADGAIPPVTMTLPDGTTLHSGDADVHARLSALTGRQVTLWSRRPPEDTEHYRRGLPDNADLDMELREMFGRLPDEPLPNFAMLPPELFQYTSPPGTYFDVTPAHLLTTASLQTLATHNPQAQFDVRRFRPNVLIDTGRAPAGLVENDWCGRRVRIGGAVFAVTIPTMRCVMPTLPTDELPKDPSVLRSIVRDADQNLGVYATVEEAGEVHVGDPVALLD